MNIATERDLDPQITRLIRSKVHRLVGTNGFRWQDAEDLRQELALHAVQGMRAHDPSRTSVIGFAGIILGNKIATIVNRATAKKRSAAKVRSLDGVHGSALIDQRTRSPLDQCLSREITQAADELPAKLRASAWLLSEHCQAGVMRRTGLSRSNVRTIRRRLAAHFTNRGLAPKFLIGRTGPRANAVHIQ